MLVIDNKSKVPIYVQIYNALKDEITFQRKKGDKLPSIRLMAKQLGVSITTVDKAYQQLLAEGYVYSQQGSGYYCNKIEHKIYEGQEKLPPSPKQNMKKVRYDFLYGSADNREFPWNHWKKCVKEALLQEEMETILDYREKQGHYHLRCSLASHLKETRGVNCQPEQIIICCGLQNAVDILSVVLPPSQYKLAFEEPGYNAARISFQRNMYELTPIKVDKSGMDIDALNKSNCNLSYVTPSHQFPTGAIMPVTRRHKLIEIMHERNGFIIEDDYDSEFRYKTLAIPSLQSLSNSDRVIYMGSLSKSLSPTLRLSYLMLPVQLLPDYHLCFRDSNTTVSNLIQAAVGEFFERGYYARHLRKLIASNEERFLATKEAFKKMNCPYIKISSSYSGLHLLIQIESPFGSEEVLQKLENAGIRIYSTRNYWIDERFYNPEQFLMGFVNYRPEEISDGIKLLCDTVNEMNKKTDLR